MKYWILGWILMAGAFQSGVAFAGCSVNIMVVNVLNEDDMEVFDIGVRCGNGLWTKLVDEKFSLDSGERSRTFGKALTLGCEACPRVFRVRYTSERYNKAWAYSPSMSLLPNVQNEVNISIPSGVAAP